MLIISRIKVLYILTLFTGQSCVRYLNNYHIMNLMESKNALAAFQGKDIRRVWHDNEWYFSVVDVVGALSESPTPRQYWGKIKDREFVGLELSPIWVQLKLPSADGKEYSTDCANAEGLFRIIQSIPSKNAEPFKLWLAKVGYDRVKEINDPELAQERMKDIYRQKGYSDEWIEKRVRGIAVRQELTDEWRKRNVIEIRWRRTTSGKSRGLRAPPDSRISRTLKKPELCHSSAA